MKQKLQFFSMLFVVGVIGVSVMALQFGSFDTRQQAQVYENPPTDLPCLNFSFDQCNSDDRCSWSEDVGCLSIPKIPTQELPCSALNFDQCRNDKGCSWSEQAGCLNIPKEEELICSAFNFNQCNTEIRCSWSESGCVDAPKECNFREENSCNANASCMWKDNTCRLKTSSSQPEVVDNQTCNSCKNGINKDGQTVTTPLNEYLEGQDGWYQCVSKGANVCVYQRTVRDGSENSSSTASTDGSNEKIDTSNLKSGTLTNGNSSTTANSSDSKTDSSDTETSNSDEKSDQNETEANTETEKRFESLVANPVQSMLKAESSKEVVEGSQNIILFLIGMSNPIN